MATTCDQSDSVVGGVISSRALLGGQHLHPSEPRTYHLERGHVENGRPMFFFLADNPGIAMKN